MTTPEWSKHVRQRRPGNRRRGASVLALFVATLLIPALAVAQIPDWEVEVHGGGAIPRA